MSFHKEVFDVRLLVTSQVHEAMDANLCVLIL